jgi:Fe2+ transport system protein B
MQAAFAGEIGAFCYFFILLYTPCGAAIKNEVGTRWAMFAAL